MTAAKLRTFVTAWRALHPTATPVALRLAAFVERWRELAPPRSPAPGGVAPVRTSPADLARVVAALRPALAAARASGASFNVWKMARLGRQELRNADLLKRLLDPRGSHGLGTLPLAGLFDALEGSASCPRPADLARCTVGVEHRPLNSDRDRVDLVVDHPELLLFVEIKIDAPEGPRQLERYAEAAEQEARFTGRTGWRVAYLTRRPVPGAPADVIALQWRGLADALRARLAPAAVDAAIRTPILHLLDHYAQL